MQRVGEREIFIHADRELSLKKEHKLFLFSIVLVSTFLDYLLLLEVQENRVSLALLLVLHLAIASILFLLVYLYHKMNYDLRLPCLAAFSTLFLGPFGGFLIVLMLLLYTPYARMTKALSITMQELFPLDPEDEISKRTYERIRFGLDVYDPEKIPLPYEAIMLYGKEMQKRRALERILKFFRPEFCSALMIALRDKSNAVRVLAATAVARIDAQYSDKIHNLEGAIKKYPKERGRLLIYARECEWQSKIIVFDPERQSKMLAKAIDSYKEYLEFFPDDEEAILALGRLNYQFGNFEESLLVLQKLIEQNKPMTPPLMKWILSALFQLKNYEKIREIARDTLTIPQETFEDKGLKKALSLWRQELK